MAKLLNNGSIMKRPKTPLHQTQWKYKDLPLTVTANHGNPKPKRTRL